MGSHNSHEVKGSGDAAGNGSGASTPRGSRGSRSGSGGGAELPGLPEKADKLLPSMVPVDKLGKLLVQLAQKEEGVNGVTENSFKKYIFPGYDELATHCYRHLVHAAGAQGTGGARGGHLPLAAFRQQCERLVALLDDALITETYVRMFSSEEEDGHVTPECLRALLRTGCRLALDHHPGGPQTCPMMERTLSAMVRGCFNNAESHSVGFVVRWLGEHCRRLVAPVHRYCVHALVTRHRGVAEGGGEPGAGAGGAPPPASALLPPSAAWAVAGAAPPLYSAPPGPPAATWLARLVCALPSHWAPLYQSRDHGLGANRFLHHTLAYRGPTVAVLQAQELVVALCCPVEWRDTHQYWGSADTALIQLEPTFSVVERGPKMLYLNSGARGYPRGLRAGADPAHPLLALDEDFNSLTFKGVTYALTAIEVWGCGDVASRETQLDVKKWQVREAERQRSVKLSAADWIEHPDRYLLELAGRPQYNSEAK